MFKYFFVIVAFGFSSLWGMNAKNVQHTTTIDNLTITSDQPDMLRIMHKKNIGEICINGISYNYVTLFGEKKKGKRVCIPEGKHNVHWKSAQSALFGTDDHRIKTLQEETALVLFFDFSMLLNRIVGNLKQKKN